MSTENQYRKLMAPKKRLSPRRAGMSKNVQATALLSAAEACLKAEEEKIVSEIREIAEKELEIEELVMKLMLKGI